MGPGRALEAAQASLCPHTQSLWAVAWTAAQAAASSQDSHARAQTAGRGGTSDRTLRMARSCSASASPSLDRQWVSARLAAQASLCPHTQSLWAVAWTAAQAAASSQDSHARAQTAGRGGTSDRTLRMARSCSASASPSLDRQWVSARLVAQASLCPHTQSLWA
eukprot:CAMPEP_0181196438 /NCGR_PEP_ID=MMETSP1096-20121128/15468_1 /TAXON_ID=156174 ORGANISM="Chrysochromulina ericina, Strain CCMP281" /NCGR_SAMPLE_ID=MMETSP1096 /ASSEMBLY_ACC=CAM_ASM_000453 /LENGTH=163 /DNA_ID=CAMNT_0023286203 /DNA_START=312 /DNA_END=800 /DNA_ORIENTATION=+